MEYILVYRDNHLWLIGPFDTKTYAADYGATWQQREWDDDPRWQVIELKDTFGLRVDPVSGKYDIAPGAYYHAF